MCNSDSLRDRLTRPLNAGNSKTLGTCLSHKRRLPLPVTGTAILTQEHILRLIFAATRSGACVGVLCVFSMPQYRAFSCKHCKQSRKQLLTVNAQTRVWKPRPAKSQLTMHHVQKLRTTTSVSPRATFSSGHNCYVVVPLQYSFGPKTIVKLYCLSVPGYVHPVYLRFYI